VSKTKLESCCEKMRNKYMCTCWFSSLSRSRL